MTGLKFIYLMLIPIGITIYTLNFGHWMRRRGNIIGAMGAYVIAILAFCLAAVVAYRGVH